MTHSSYPVALDLYGKPVLVVGGGALAVEKVEGLLRVQAQVRVVDPRPSAALHVAARGGEIALAARPYRPDDLAGITLAYGASDDRALNAAVAADARTRGVLVNAVDDIPNCDFFAVSLVRRGDLQVAISTNGRSPAMARWVREYLDAWLPSELGGLLDVLAEVRDEVRQAGTPPEYAQWKAAITDDVLLRLRHEDRVGARETIRERLSEPLSVAAGEPALGSWKPV